MRSAAPTPAGRLLGGSQVFNDSRVWNDEVPGI